MSLLDWLFKRKRPRPATSVPNPAAPTAVPRPAGPAKPAPTPGLPPASTRVPIKHIATNAKEASWNIEKDAVEKRELIQNTWNVRFRALRVSEHEAEELRRQAPLDTNFRDVNDEYQIRLSTNSIFVHPFGSWADPGYVAFFYKDKVYYVNVALGVPIAPSLYRRADTLSYMAMILVVLHEHIGMDRMTHLIALEGDFTNPNV